MRIDLFGSAATSGTEQVTGGATQGVKPGAGLLAAAQQETDRTTISSNGLSVATLASKAMDAAAGRSDRVEALRQSVNSGDYKLEPDAIAQAILKDRA